MACWSTINSFLRIIFFSSIPHSYVRLNDSHSMFFKWMRSLPKSLRSNFVIHPEIGSLQLDPPRLVKLVQKCLFKTYKQCACNIQTMRMQIMCKYLFYQISKIIFYDDNPFHFSLCIIFHWAHVVFLVPPNGFLG